MMLAGDAAEVDPPNSPTIAVVDDETLICALLTETLREWGASVYCAHDGAEGAELLRSRPFDLAVIDVMLPHGSGLALANVAAEQNIPVLMMSGHPDGQTLCKRLDVALLPKPFRLDSFTRAVGTALADKTEAVRRQDNGRF